MSTFAMLDVLPLPVVFLLLITLFVLPYELGFRLGRGQGSGEGAAQAGAVVGALFALVGFFLAFTFNTVNTFHSERKQLVVAEANSIGTAYLRSQLVPEPFSGDLQDDLRHYVDLRLQGAQLNSAQDTEALLAVIVESEELLEQIWQRIQALSDAEDVDPVMRGLLVEAINEVIDTHTLRITAAFKRLPIIIVFSIGLTIMLTMSVLAYPAGIGGKRSPFTILALVLSLSLVCMLIIALERPGGALFDVSQKAMIDLRQTM